MMLVNLIYIYIYINREITEIKTKLFVQRQNLKLKHTSEQF